MTELKEMNEFLATTVASMNEDQLQNWNNLSDFERKMITAQSFFFKKNIERINRSKRISKVAYSNFK